MQVIDTSQLPPDMDADTTYWVYNGLDCCLTEEIHSKLEKQLNPEHTQIVYNRSMALQAPILEMQLRGVRIDKARRKELITTAQANKKHIQTNFDTMCVEGVGIPAPINPASHTQVKNFLYNTLNLPVVKARNSAGKMAPSSSREALEKLSQHFIAEPFTSHLLALRDWNKQIGFLNTKLGTDGRMRCNFNIAGTKNGRLNSSFSDYGDGTNLQNVSPFLRQVFIPDEGKAFINIDLEQADSRNVGALCWNIFVEEFGEDYAGSYLDACESGDLHTLVASMAYPQLSWDPENMRAVANQIAYRGLSYRDLSKKLGHGTNYYGQPKTMSKHAKVPVGDIVTFQDNYFGSFPVIQNWHDWTINELQTKGAITSPFSRRRTFFGRPDDQSTINSAIAFNPQSMTGDEMNEGMIALSSEPVFEMLIQVHDSILMQVPQDRVNELTHRALSLLEVHIPLARGRDFHVPLEAMTGWNWGYGGDKNPYGLKKFKGSEDRTPPRKRFIKKSSFLDFV